jgi:hypothetical protein
VKLVYGWSYIPIGVPTCSQFQFPYRILHIDLSESYLMMSHGMAHYLSNRSTKLLRPNTPENSKKVKSLFITESEIQSSKS